jgi:hypothetical protein
MSDFDRYAFGSPERRIDNGMTAGSAAPDYSDPDDEEPCDDLFDTHSAKCETCGEREVCVADAGYPEDWPDCVVECRECNLPCGTRAEAYVAPPPAKFDEVVQAMRSIGTAVKVGWEDVIDYLPGLEVAEIADALGAKSYWPTLTGIPGVQPVLVDQRSGWLLLLYVVAEDTWHAMNEREDKTWAA